MILFNKIFIDLGYRKGKKERYYKCNRYNRYKHNVVMDKIIGRKCYCVYGDVSIYLRVQSNFSRNCERSNIFQFLLQL